MPKRKVAKSRKKSQKVAKPIKRHRITPEERLEHLILVSERAITGQGTSIDDFFRQQADRLKKELEELRNGLRK